MNKLHIIYSALLSCLLFFTQAIQANVTERLYMQTDKNTYLAGEIIWLSIRTTSLAGIPQDFSKVAYVELSGEDAAVQQIKLTLDHASGNGWMEIPADLPTGYYNLTAYTRYMRNEGESVFFSKNIAVVNTFQKVNMTHTDSTSTGEKAVSQPSAPVKNIISVHTDKSLYASRILGKLTITGIPEDLKQLSVSIAGEDIKGADGENTDITAWSKKLHASQPVPFSAPDTILPEYEGHIITGKLINTESGNAESSNTVTPLIAFPGDEIRVFYGNTDEEGNVRFVTKRTDGWKQVTTIALNPGSESSPYRIDLQAPYAQRSFTALPTLELEESWYNNLLLRSIGLQSLHAYYKEEISVYEDTVQSTFCLKPDLSYKLADYTRFSTMNEVFVEFISNARFREIDGKKVLSVLSNNGMGYTGSALVLLDGVPVRNHEDILQYDPSLVSRIDIYRSNYIISNTMFNGIVHFITQKQDLTGYKMDNSTQLLNYDMPQAKRRFYAPDYSRGNTASMNLPDFRHTLLWEPCVQVNNREKIEIPFSTSDLKGKFVITVEGITQDGEAVYSRKEITVK